MILSLANVIAGLGLFFAGIWFLSENLKHATGRRFRRWAIAWTRTAPMGFCVGAVAGALTQSMSVTVFILVGLMRAGLIGVANALPLLLGANVGLSVLVFVATLETQLVMLFVIGIVGFVIGLNPPDRFRPLVGALFGLSMLFLGIDLIQSGTVPLLEHEYAEELLARARESYLTGFLAGAVLTCVSQSSAAVTILAITLADAGVFGVEQTIMTIYGTMIGSSAITAILSWNLRGRSMQIAMFQIVVNVVGCAVMVPLFYLEVYGDVPLIESLVVWLTPQIDTQLAWVYLLFSFAAGIPLLLTLKAVAGLLDRLFPPTAIEDLSKPRFIYDAATLDTETAIDLILRELRRELDHLPVFLEHLKPGAADAKGSLADRLAAYTMLSNRVAEFIDATGRKAPSYADYDRLNDLYSQQHLINSTATTLYELASALEVTESRAALKPLTASAVLAHGRILQDAIDTAHNRPPAAKAADVESAKSAPQVLHEMRDALIDGSGELTADERAQLFRIANLFERFSWLLSHLPLDRFARIDGA